MVCLFESSWHATDSIILSLGWPCGQFQQWVNSGQFWAKTTPNIGKIGQKFLDKILGVFLLTLPGFQPPRFATRPRQIFEQDRSWFVDAEPKIWLQLILVHILAHPRCGSQSSAIMTRELYLQCKTVKLCKFWPFDPQFIPKLEKSRKFAIKFDF